MCTVERCWFWIGIFSNLILSLKVFIVYGKIFISIYTEKVFFLNWSLSIWIFFNGKWRCEYLRGTRSRSNENLFNVFQRYNKQKFSIFYLLDTYEFLWSASDPLRIPKHSVCFKWEKSSISLHYNAKISDSTKFNINRSWICGSIIVLAHLGRCEV